MKKLQTGLALLILILTIFSSFNFAFQSASASPPTTGDIAWSNASASYTSVSKWQQQPTTNLKLNTTSPPFGIDGQTYSSINAASGTITLSTTYSNDLIVLVCAERDTSSVGISDTAGLTWTKRAVIEYYASSYSWLLAYYYAIASSPLQSDTITITPSLSLYDAIAFGISDVNTTSPFDSNVGTPVYKTGSSGTSASVSLTTSDAPDMVLGLAAAGYGEGGPFTIGSGFSSVYAGATTDTYAEYEIVSSPQSGMPVSISWSSSIDYALLADAVRGLPNDVYNYESVTSSFSLPSDIASYTLNWTAQLRTNATYNSLTQAGATSGFFTGSLSTKTITFSADFQSTNQASYTISYFLSENTTAPETDTYSAQSFSYDISQNGNYFNSSYLYFNYSDPSGASSSYSISYKFSFSNLTLTNPSAPIEDFGLSTNPFTYDSISKSGSTVNIVAYANYSSAQSANIKFDTTEEVNYYPTIVSTSIGWTGTGSQAELTVNAENIGGGYSFTTESLQVVNVNWGDGSALGSSAIQYGSYDWGFYHNYTQVGTYTVSFQVVNFVGSSNSLSKSATGTYTVTTTISTSPTNYGAISPGQNIWFNYTGTDVGLTSLTLQINGISQFTDSFQSSLSQSVSFAPTYAGTLDIVWSWVAGSISGSVSLTYGTSTTISATALYVLVNYTYSGNGYSNYFMWAGQPIAYNLTYSYYTWTYTLPGESSDVTIKVNPTWDYIFASPGETTYYPSNATVQWHIAQTDSVSVTFLIKDPPQPASFEITYYPTSAVYNFFGASLSFSDLHTYVNGQLLESDYVNAIIGDTYRIQAYDLIGNLVANVSFYVQYQTSFDNIPVAIYPVTISNQNSTYELGLNVSTQGFSQSFPYISPSGSSPSGYTIWVYPSSYWFNFTYINTENYQVVQTVPLLRSVSGASFINIAGVTISQLAISQQRNAQNYTNLVENVNITFANEYSKIYNETLGVNVNVNDVNTSVHSFLISLLTNVSFIKSFVQDMNSSIKTDFTITNDIINSFQSNLTVVTTYINDTVSTIKNLEVQFNSNLTIANSSISELSFLSSQRSVYLNDTIYNDYESTLQNVTNIYSYVRGMNVTQLDYLTALQTTVNSIKSNVTVTQSYINDTVGQVDSYMATVENVILSNITTSTQNISVRENVIKNLVSFELSQQNASLSYKLLFGTPTVIDKESYEFPVFVESLNGVLANLSVTTQASKNLSLFYESGNTTQFLNFTVKDVKAGSFNLFINNLNGSEVNDIKGNEALIQAQSELKTGASAYTAVGITGYSQFSDMKTLSSILSFFGFKTPAPGGIIPDIKWFFSSAIGIPSSVLVSGLVGFYYLWKIEEEWRNKNKEKQKEEEEEKMKKEIHDIHESVGSGNK